MRFIGRREGVSARARASRWTGPRRRPRDNERITLFVAFNYGGRAEILDAAARFDGRRRGGVPRAALRARDARSRPRDPHQRRAAPVELPALAVRLLRARLPRRAVARLHARGVRGGARGVRRRASAASGAADAPRPAAPAQPPSRAARARRRGAGQRSDLGARVLAAIPADRARDRRSSRCGGCVFTRRAVRARRDLRCTSCSRCSTARPARAASAGFLGARRAARSPRSYGGQSHTVLLALVAALPVVFLLGARPAAARGRARASP